MLGRSYWYASELTYWYQIHDSFIWNVVSYLYPSTSVSACVRWGSFGRWLQFVSSENTDWDNWTPPEGPSTSAAPPTDANHQWNEMHKYLISGSEKESSASSLRLYKIFHIRQTEPRPGPGGTKKRKKCYWENCKICFYIYYEHFHGNWPDLALKLDLLPEEIKKILFWTGGLREVYNKYGIIHCLMQTNLI